jgi:hypothetical protein
MTTLLPILFLCKDYFAYSLMFCSSLQLFTDSTDLAKSWILLHTCVDHWSVQGLMLLLTFHQYELPSSPQLIEHCTPEPAHQRDQQGVKRSNRWVALGCSMFDANLHTRELIWQARCIITLRMTPSSSWRVLPSAPFTSHDMFPVSACKPSVSTVICPWQCTNMHRTWSKGGLHFRSLFQYRKDPAC